jgi:N-carbamoylputrescine amidase
MSLFRPSRRELQFGAIGVAASPAASASAVRRLNLSVAQMQSVDGDIDGNLRRATGLAQTARADGAELVLFPELMPTGYALDKSIWLAAEPRVGPTARWLAATSRRLGCAIGASFLEAQDGAFYNTFVLAGADGRELGRVRKETPASGEVPFFRGEAGPHMIEAPFGRIGVGICYENYLCSLERHFAAGRPDLILQPHSFPGMAQAGGTASPPGTFVAAWHAKRFGVPVAMTNKVGPWSTIAPSGRRVYGGFPGASAIVGADGETLALLGDQPGVAVAQVTLDPARKAASAPTCEGELILDLTKFDWRSAD